MATSEILKKYLALKETSKQLFRDRKFQECEEVGHQLRKMWDDLSAEDKELAYLAAKGV